MISLVRFASRQLHTIVSREIIKPSSPTPFHLKTYNLSLIDQFAPDAYTPFVIFYPNSNISSNSHVTILDMKNSLSETLKQYYPFAGRVAKTTPFFVDCNDHGVEFPEAHNDEPLLDFLQKTQHKDLDQLVPNGQVFNKLSNSYNFEDDRSRASPLAIQVNHFACGGIGVAVSLSHKLGDGSSMANFVNDWAIITRLRSKERNYVSPINPLFISSKSTNLNYQGLSGDKSRDDFVTRSFMFAGSKLNDLKLKVIAMTAKSKQPIMNPTRVEVLNWLLYKCAIQAATNNNLGYFKPTGFTLATNIRNKMTESLPETAIGNYTDLPSCVTKDPNEVTPGFFISQIKKLKMEVPSVEKKKTFIKILPRMFLETIIKEEQRKFDDYYVSTSLCRYPLYGIDFGWGKPVKVTIPGTLMNNYFRIMDAKDEGDALRKTRHGDFSERSLFAFLLLIYQCYRVWNWVKKHR